MNIEFIKETGLLKFIYRKTIRQLYKRVLRKTQEMTLPSGAIFYMPPLSQFATEAYITNGNVDWGSESLLYRLHPPSGVFLDIGANIGYYSVYLSPVSSKIFAFEPDPKMRKYLDSNALDRNISIIPKAISNRAASLSFKLMSSGEFSHLVEDGEIGESDIIQVDTTTIDLFITENFLKVNTIKIDIEGFDFQALEGARDTMFRQRPIVLTEAQITPEILEFVREVKYSIVAYRREISTRKKEFVDVIAVPDSRYAFKMLFLVPDELRTKVIEAEKEVRAP